MISPALGIDTSKLKFNACLINPHGKLKHAAMRKLIHLAYGVLKTGQPFDPQWAKSA